MAVYVDDMRARYGRLTLCHMIADTREELYQMVDAIDLDRCYVQNVNSYREHFDVSLTKRARAVDLGAQEVTQRQLASMVTARRPVDAPAAP